MVSPLLTSLGIFICCDMVDSLERVVADEDGAELMPESWELLEIWSADGGIYCCTGPFGGLWSEYGRERK